MSHFDASFLEEADMALLRGVLGIPARPLAPLTVPVAERQTARRREARAIKLRADTRSEPMQRGAA